MTSFHFSHYLVVPWLHPPGIIIFFGLIGWLLCWRYRIFGNILVLLCFMALWLFSAPIFAYNLLDLLQNRYAVLSLDALPLPSQDTAIVILGGGDVISLEQNNRYTVSDTTLGRLRYAALLHRKTGVPIIVSGGYDPGRTESGASSMQDVLQNEFGIKNILKEEESTNTEEEAKALVPLLKKYHFKQIYLVGNAWHMPRSVYIFKKYNIKVIPAPMGFEVYDHHYSILSFFPNIRALCATVTAFHEYTGLLWYYFKYR